VRLKLLAVILVFGGVLASFAGSVPAAATSAAEPVAVVVSASYDRWYDNVELIGTISGSPDLAQGLQSMLNLATANQGLVGLDQKRPWAAILTAQGPSLAACVYLPVDRLDALLDVLRPLASDIVRHDDSREIVLAGGGTIHAAQRGRWVVAALDADTVNQSAADPMPLVADLAARYDLAVRLHVSRLSEPLPTILLATLDRAAEDTARRPEESESSYAARRELNLLAARAARKGFEDLDCVTAGLKMDHSARRAVAELTLVAKKETPTARRWSEYRKQNSHLAGFWLPGATLRAHWAGPLSPATIDWLISAIDREVPQEPNRAREEAAPPATDASAETLATALSDALRSLPAGERLEFSTSAIVRPDALTWISAMRLPADGQLRQKIEHCLSVAQRDPELRIDVRRAADREGEVSLHVLSWALGDFADQKVLTALVGQRLDVVIGLGKEYFYLAAGRGALQSLTGALAVSRERPMVQSPPVECSVALRPIAATIAALGKEQGQGDAIRIAHALKQPAGKDHVGCIVDPIDGGIRVRVELEEGVLGIAGLAVGLLGQGQETPEPGPGK